MDQVIQTFPHAVPENLRIALRQIFLHKHPGTDRIIDIVIDVGDLIGKPYNLPFQRGWASARSVV